MKLTSLKELKNELQHLQTRQLAELCIRLAKYKKENKDYLGYLLFRSHDRHDFMVQVKTETDNHFTELKKQKNLYYIRKGLRKMLRIINKYCKYVGDKAATAELLIYFCMRVKESGIPIHKSARLKNLYYTQIRKIKSLTAHLHGDLQADYLKILDEIMIFP